MRYLCPIIGLTTETYLHMHMHMHACVYTQIRSYEKCPTILSGSWPGMGHRESFTRIDSAQSMTILKPPTATLVLFRWTAGKLHSLLHFCQADYTDQCIWQAGSVNYFGTHEARDTIKNRKQCFAAIMAVPSTQPFLPRALFSARHDKSFGVQNRS